MKRINIVSLIFVLFLFFFSSLLRTKFLTTLIDDSQIKEREREREGRNKKRYGDKSPINRIGIRINRDEPREQ